MADTAARWADRVLPGVPWRQWVLTVPFELRLWMAWDTDLMTDVLTLFQRAIRRRLRLLAQRKGVRDGRHASVTVIQRFGSSLNLNVHFHSLVADGVWAPGRGAGDRVRWVPLRLTTADVEAVLRTVARKVVRLLCDRGLLVDDDEDATPPPFADLDPDQQLALALMEASVAQRIATGPRAGRRVERVGTRPTSLRPAPAARPVRPMLARRGNFDLHAATRIRAKERHRLECMARYLLRPPIATDRLRIRPDGNYEYDLRRPWADGTTGFVFTPHELMEKLAALIPMPRANLVRYHGVLAPASSFRAAVVPRPDEEGRVCGHRHPGGPVPKDRVPWAWLLRRVFHSEVLRCARCGGPRRLLAEITHPDAIRGILEHLGLPLRSQAPRPARAAPPPGLLKTTRLRLNTPTRAELRPKGSSAPVGSHGRLQPARFQGCQAPTRSSDEAVWLRGTCPITPRSQARVDVTPLIRPIRATSWPLQRWTGAIPSRPPARSRRSGGTSVVPGLGHQSLAGSEPGRARPALQRSLDQPLAGESAHARPPLQPRRALPAFDHR